MRYTLPWWVATFGHNETVVDFKWGMCGNIRYASWLTPNMTMILGDGWNMSVPSLLNVYFVL